MCSTGLSAEFAGTLASLEPHGIASTVIGSLRIVIKVRITQIRGTKSADLLSTP